MILHDHKKVTISRHAKEFDGHQAYEVRVRKTGELLGWVAKAVNCRPTWAYRAQWNDEHWTIPYSTRELAVDHLVSYTGGL